MLRHQLNVPIPGTVEKLGGEKDFVSLPAGDVPFASQTSELFTRTVGVRWEGWHLLHSSNRPAQESGAVFAA